MDEYDSMQMRLLSSLHSNLCTEIIEYSDEHEVAVCNLASIALNMFVKPDKTYDFEKLKYVSKVITRNLNKIIDINFYPIPEAERSNKRHRPIGIGVQGNNLWGLPVTMIFSRPSSLRNCYFSLPPALTPVFPSLAFNIFKYFTFLSFLLRFFLFSCVSFLPLCLIFPSSFLYPPSFFLLFPFSLPLSPVSCFFVN